MKRISYLGILLMLMFIALVGCSNEESVSNEQNGQEMQMDKQKDINNTVAEINETLGIGVDNSLLTVEVTLPAEITGDLTEFNKEEYLSLNVGFKDVKINENGSFTIVMTKVKHKAMMEEFRNVIDSSLEELIDGVETPYIKSIDHTNDYREVYIDVVREEYENALDYTPYIVGFSVGMYQSISAIDINTTIIINDEATGEVICSVKYPDAWVVE